MSVYNLISLAKRWLPLAAGLAGLCSGPLGQAQTLADQYQALPVTTAIKADFYDDTDSVRLQAEQRLRVYVRHQVDSLMARRGGYHPPAAKERWQRGALLRVASDSCPYRLLVWEDVLAADLITLTPTFRVLDARVVAEYFPPMWSVRPGRRTFGTTSSLDVDQLTCSGFRTRATSEQFYGWRGPSMITSRVVTNYRITPAGRIVAITPPAAPKRRK